MCGIAGIVNFNAPEDKQELLSRMIGLLGHRGPDAAGMLLGDTAGLAHTRLSIIDPAGGDQPIHNEDRTVWVVFNGEIFNYPELRRELVEAGHSFSTTTDTEVLVHLYEELGPEMVQRLNGQFAVALWDARRRKILLIRDRLGIRPLFYSIRGRRLLFGSEIKALFADRSLTRELDLQTLSDVFTCWSPVGQATAFAGISQVQPGNMLSFSEEGVEASRYWRLPFLEEPDQDRADQRSVSEWTEAFAELILDAVRIRLRADVPVGAYVSGGLDSTYISSLVRRRFNNELHSFSVRFDDARFDESSYQSLALKDLQTRHRSIACRNRDIGEVFPDVVWHAETPILRTAPAPLHKLSSLVRQSCFKVVLTGEGADEVLAGYNIFKEDRIRRFWARDPGSSMRPKLLQRLYPYVFTQEKAKAAQFLKAYFRRGLTDLDDPLYSHALRWRNTSQLKAFLAQGANPAAGGDDDLMLRVQSRLPGHFMRLDPLSRAQAIEMTLFLSNYLLSSQGDRMTMANSVEGRYPFLDHRVVEFAAKLPPKYRLNGLKEKYLLKKAARGLVSEKLVDRPKQPYRAPISGSFFGDGSPGYVQDLLSDRAIRQSGVFDAARVSRLVEKCRRQRSGLPSERENMALVGILSTQLLHEQFIEGSPADRSVTRQDIRVHRLEAS